ncbi:MAG: hypothetical protein ACHQHN_08200 [Sphingobacteriales bacterium]
MKIIRYLLFFIIIVNSNCSKSKYNLTIHFRIDDKNINIKNEFRIYFLEKNNKLEAKVNGNFLTLPDFSKDTVTAFFLYRNYRLEFKTIEVNRLRLNQNMDWTFKILNTNVDQLSASLNLGQVKKIYIWEFNPLDHGGGIDITVPVYK